MSFFAGFGGRHAAPRRDLEEAGRHARAAAREERRHHDHQQQRIQHAPPRRAQGEPKVGITKGCVQCMPGNYVRGAFGSKGEKFDILMKNCSI